MKSNVRARAIKNGYRSGLEEKVAKQLEEAGVSYQYEKLKVPYELAETRKYTVDFPVVKAYDGDEGRVLENARLLWLRRYENQMWEPPND